MKRIYIANLTVGALLIPESRKIAGLMLKAGTSEEWKAAIEKQNLLQKLSPTTSKKIASFLSISHKTVSNHIHNIMLKIRCNSREGIIDFINNSDKLEPIRNHYLHILIKIAFEKELKQINSSTKNHINCLIFDYKKQNLKNYKISKNKNFSICCFVFINICSIPNILSI